MVGHSFRFLHAAGFHLEATLAGIADPPPHWAELLADALYTSCRAVFQAAVHEEVDFLLLSGDLADVPRAGPRAVAFLQEQFEQLAERGIRVYWAVSELDQRGNWLSEVDWPENLQLFASDRPQEVLHRRGDLPLAMLVGRGWHPQRPLRPTDFAVEGDELPRIAVVPGTLETSGQRGLAHYWALGGPLQTVEPQGEEGWVHSPGGPQGMTLKHSGPRGCTLVTMDPLGETRMRSIPAAAVRWCQETVAVRGGVSRQEIQQLLRKRITQLVGQTENPILVGWQITGEDRFETYLLQRRRRDELVQWLRDEFASGAVPVWTLSLELEPPEALPTNWLEEDSILGDYLRVVRDFQQDVARPIDWEVYLGERMPDELAQALEVRNSGARQRVLREAALLGADMLRGDDTGSLPHE